MSLSSSKYQKRLWINLSCLSVKLISLLSNMFVIFLEQRQLFNPASRYKVECVRKLFPKYMKLFWYTLNMVFRAVKPHNGTH